MSNSRKVVNPVKSLRQDRSGGGPTATSACTAAMILPCRIARTAIGTIMKMVTKLVHLELWRLNDVSNVWQ
jgi:hypothetical protein